MRAALAAVAAHVRTPVVRDGYALVLNSAITAVIGLGYWIVAARVYPPEVVGVNAALISSMMFIAGVAQLNLSNILVRFVPDAGRMVRRLIVASYAVSLGVAAVAATLFVLGIGIWGDELEPVTSVRGFDVWFVAATMAWCAFVLQDSALTGLGRAVWVPAENAVFSVAKLALLVGFAGAAPVYGIFASWTAALLVSLVPVNLLVFGRLVPRAMRSATRDALSVTRRELAVYVVADYAGAVAWLALTTLPPVIVAHELGARQTAYFSLAWAIAVPIYFVPTSIGASLVVHAVRERERLEEYTRKAVVQFARLLLPAAAALVVAGPFLLRLLGHDYAEESSTVMRILVLSAIPNGVNILYVSVARVERRMSRVVAVLAGQAAITLGLAVPLVRVDGIVGLSIAWLLGQSLVAAAIVIANRRVLVRTRVAGRAARGEA
ncbi:MAG TPA: hypothetical protein VGJ77_03415 [Gaiellaceae bacterium]